MVKAYYSDFFPAFLILAQRAFANAESLALAAALIFFLFAVANEKLSRLGHKFSSPLAAVTSCSGSKPNFV